MRKRNENWNTTYDKVIRAIESTDFSFTIPDLVRRTGSNYHAINIYVQEWKKSGRLTWIEEKTAGNTPTRYTYHPHSTIIANRDTLKTSGNIYANQLNYLAKQALTGEDISRELSELRDSLLSDIHKQQQLLNENISLAENDDLWNMNSLGTRYFQERT